MTKTCPHCHATVLISDISDCKAASTEIDDGCYTDDPRLGVRMPATVLSTSQPERVGMPEALRLLRKISDLAYDEDVGEPLDCAIDYANKAIAALAATPALEPEKSLDAAAERASHMPGWMTRTAAPAVGWTPDPKAPWRCLICGSERSACTCLPREGVTPAVGGEREALRKVIQSAWDNSCNGFEVDVITDAVLAAPPASPLRGRDSTRDILLRLSAWCAIERGNLGAIDGYDYRSGEEFGLRRAEIEIEKQYRALSASPPEQPAAAAMPWIDAEEGDMS